MRSDQLPAARAGTDGPKDQRWATWIRNGSGATLSDKTAREEFELTQDEIVEAIGAGQLHYRINSTHGNPWFRLVRREVEDLVKTKFNEQHLKEAQARAELKRVNRELKQLWAQLSPLEKRRAKLIADLGQ